jgi:hypothetical protein
MAGPIRNAANYPLFARAGTIPDVSGALQDYFQMMTFSQVTKTVQGFQVDESALPINFQGCWFPYSERQLLMLPEGQRSWSHFMLFADPTLTLQTDDVVLWNGIQTRVLGRMDYGLYGYVQYHLCQDFTGSGP